MESKIMAEDSLPRLDPEPWVSINMGPTAKKKECKAH